jgi:hypothetical protein
MNPEDRAWEVVKRAFEEREPRQRSTASNRLLLAAAVVAVGAVVAAALSPPGHAVFERMRRAVGVEHAAPALISLPAPGRLLAVAHGSVDLVHRDGLRRDLGAFDDAAWSPHGLYLVATRGNELVALDAEGDVHWTLPRIDPSWPTWEGSRTDTRIAYIAASGLRVVAGDGTGDHLLDASAGDVPPAWDPARLHTVAYYSGGAIVLRRADGRLVWRTTIEVTPSSLAWSTDGRFLAVFSSRQVEVLSASGNLVEIASLLGAAPLAGAFAPHTHHLAILLRYPRRSEVRLIDVDHPGRGKLLFAGPGNFGDLAWSPNGAWLLVTWPAANQWVFIHGKSVRAVANIRSQLGQDVQIAGRWCCPSG